MLACSLLPCILVQINAQQCIRLPVVGPRLSVVLCEYILPSYCLTGMMLCATRRPEDAAVAAAGGAGAAASAATSSSSNKPKKTPEDISYDAMVLLLTSFKTCYMAVAKSIHTPSRRREEAANVPTIPMKAAALNLALVLVGNLQKQPWEDSLGTATLAATGDGTEASSSSSSTAAEQQLSAVTAKVRARSPHFVRLAEEVHYVLFDSRRNHCHLLVLNYFTALGGMQVSCAIGRAPVQQLFKRVYMTPAASMQPLQAYCHCKQTARMLLP
jgi:hypothetical protein